MIFIFQNILSYRCVISIFNVIDRLVPSAMMVSAAASLTVHILVASLAEVLRAELPHQSVHIFFLLLLLFLTFTWGYVYRFYREKGRGRERNIDVGDKHPSVASHMHPSWESNLQPAAQAWALTRNWTCDLLCIGWLSNHWVTSPGLYIFLINIVKLPSRKVVTRKSPTSSNWKYFHSL